MSRIIQLSVTKSYKRHERYLPSQVGVALDRPFPLVLQESFLINIAMTKQTQDMGLKKLFLLVALLLQVMPGCSSRDEQRGW